MAVSIVHNFRKWGGLPFGTPPSRNIFTGRQEPVEPFPGACGDCGKPESVHPIVTERPETLKEAGEKLYEALRAVQMAVYMGEDEDDDQIEAALRAWEKRNG